MSRSPCSRLSLICLFVRIISYLGNPSASSTSTPPIFPPLNTNGGLYYNAAKSEGYTSHHRIASNKSAFSSDLPGGARQNCWEIRPLSVWDYGTITSPDYPGGHSPSLFCQWLLLAPGGTIIHATIFDIYIQTWEDNRVDSLSISRDGNLISVENYSGNQNDKTPFTIQSIGTRLGIRLKLANLLISGFKLSYVVKPVDPSEGDFESNDDGICGRSTYPGLTPSLPKTAGNGQVSKATVNGNSSRIFGNNPADRYSLPWMVSIRIDNKFSCGGFIIDDSHVMTAASCTFRAEKITKLLIGAHDISALHEELPRIVVNVRKEDIFAHPKYYEDLLIINHDIAIIRLPDKLTFADNIRPVCLPNRKYLAETFEGAVSYGDQGSENLGADHGMPSSVLQKTNLTMLGNPACKEFLYINGNNICAGTTRTQSACDGDNGGPMMIREGDDLLRYTAVGIFSYGGSICEGGYNLVFTRITAFMDYISKITGRKL
ncbi:Serine proteinase stubble [Folsomia candida]|uniref:Serine proteinase stubble n=1 Tax=Folsomia candida TaxID=158441 RepID=A0A226DL44_FOLCA|nr:Serine proteinase stubble [Folsomia candida]